MPPFRDTDYQNQHSVASPSEGFNPVPGGINGGATEVPVNQTHYTGPAPAAPASYPDEGHVQQGLGQVPTEIPVISDPHAIAKSFQHEINMLAKKQVVAEDGVIGPQTLAAAAAYKLTVPPNAYVMPGIQQGGAPAPASAPAASGGGGGTGGGSAPAGGAPAYTPPPDIAAASDAQLNTYIFSHYPQMAWAVNDPELGPIIKDAARRGLGPEEFMGQVEATNWWKSHGAAARQWAQLQTEDPAEAARKIQAQTLSVRLEFSKLGVPVDDATLGQIAKDSLTFAWTPEELKNAIGQKVSFSGQPIQGDIGAEMTQLRGKASGDYMVDIGDQTLFDWAKNIYMGAADEAGFDNYLTSAAKSKWSSIAQYIDQGITPKQFFDPYRQQTAKLLETTPDQVDFNNPKFQKMTTVADPSGNLRPMTLYEAGDYVRGLSDYRSTDQANQQAAELAQYVGQKFGTVAA